MATLNRKEISRRYYIKHKIKILKKKKIYNKLNAKRISKQRRQYYLKNKLKFIQLHKKYVEEHKEILEEYRKFYSKTHKKERQKYNAGYYKTNRTKINYKRNEYFKNRKKKDINFKIKCNLRSRISDVLKENPKLSTTIKLIGCSLSKFKKHLQKQFKQGMTWDNYGFYGWHIDHIKPCCTFDLSKASEQRKCFNYKNLQPLWAKENLRKNKF